MTPSPEPGCDMREILDLHLNHFVKVKVKFNEVKNGQKKTTRECLILDPQSSTYIKLRKRLASLLNIEGEFSICFKKDRKLISLTSDFDLDGAFHEASKPHLNLTVDQQVIDKTLEEWDIICPADIINMDRECTRSSEERKSLAGSIISQVETAMLKVQRAFSFDFNLSHDELAKFPMDELEYKNLLDKDGRVVSSRDLHMAVYKGGVEPSVRPTVWKHLLNIFPAGMTLQERSSYMNSKCEEYYQLRYRWQHLMQAGTIPEVLQDITNMVRKDVRRTDRTEKFFSGSEDSGNVRALFNILTTYAVNHPSVSYCQGMSDLLSPILYVMKRESEAYVCFCGLMRRAQTNFKLDGRSMKLKFRHLQKMLRFYDPELHSFLKDEESLDLLFCYRWLLLDLKREFSYTEMLHLMEILWGSLPPRPPQKALDLYEVKFPTAAICNALKDRTTKKDHLQLKENYFGRVETVTSFSHSVSNNATAAKIEKWAARVRRESIARDFENHNSTSDEEIQLPVHYRKRKYRSYISGKLGRLNSYVPASELTIKSCKIPTKKKSHDPVICQSWSCGEVFEEQFRIRDALYDKLYDARDFLRNQWCYSNTVNEIQLNNWLNGRGFQIKKDTTSGSDSGYSDGVDRRRHVSSPCTTGMVLVDCMDINNSDVTSARSRRSQSDGYMSDMGTKEASTYESDYEEDGAYDSDDEEEESEEFSEDDDFVDSMAGGQYEEVGTYFDRKKEMLPAPHVLGDGNPFLLFLCIAMIQNHKDVILRQKMDFNELGIYFDKLVRKHKLYKVLRNAQSMFKEYLNMGWDVEDKGEVSDDTET